MKKLVMVLCIISNFSLFASETGYSGHVYGYGETQEAAIKDGTRLAKEDNCDIKSISVEHTGGRYKASVTVSDCEDDESSWPY